MHKITLNNDGNNEFISIAIDDDNNKLIVWTDIGNYTYDAESLIDQWLPMIEALNQIRNNIKGDSDE